MYAGDMMRQVERAVDRAKVVPIRETIGELRREWSAIVHHDGYGWDKDSRCYARIYSDGQKAVVVLTELGANRGASVTNCVDRIATKMREAVINFIPASHFPDKVVWMEQYEKQPDEIDLVVLLWDTENRRGQSLGKFSHPTWHRLTEATSRMYGVRWEELCRVPEH